jgi:hypothetical protein
MKNVYEHFFILKYFGGWSFVEAYNLPVGLRNWFLERLSKQKEEEREVVEKAMGKNSKSHGPRFNSR